MNKSFIAIIASYIILLTSCQNRESFEEKVNTNKGFEIVKTKALKIMETGFNAGEGYGEVWIRDYNTFIELGTEVFPKETLKENLRVFFRLQREDGNIVDGFIPKNKVKDSKADYAYIFTEQEPDYSGHKNTVETDQESSLVQAVYKYVKKTGDHDFLNEIIANKTVAERLEWSMEFLLSERWSDEYGLIWGATTVDWGDVQHCHKWGVFLTDDTKYSLDIYDNAMMVIALKNLIEIVPSLKDKWQPICDGIAENTMKHLWDTNNQKFFPHVYLDGSPFPDDFKENEIFYHGGTAVAIEAGLLSDDLIKVSLEKMISNVKAIGAGSIGLTIYPSYPAGYFENESMSPYGYQNGGDWTWFGARMIQQLAINGFVEEAYEQLLPMTDRVVANNGFFEWYTIKNEPRGSGTFRGSAGVLYKAIELLEEAVAE